MTKLSPLPFVIVEWEDAWKDAVGDTTVATAPEGHKPIQCFSHGYVLQDDAAGIQLANEHSPNGTYRHTAFIPRKMIVDVTPYKLTKPREKKVAAPKEETPVCSSNQSPV